MDYHAAFLASQAPLHPILQQLQTLDQHLPDLYQSAVIADNELITNTPDVSLDYVDIAQEGLQESTSEEVFSSYQHRNVIPGCKPHPGDIVEAAPLAAIELPKEYYPITETLPAEAVKDCKLSSLQLEGIIHACQRHQIILANGQRAGFFIGDGAGVGKGRQIAGIIMDNIARGRPRHVWFSMSGDLIVDAKRDLTDIGCYARVIDGCQELDRETRAFGLPLGLKEGVVFSTYSTLVSSVQHGGKFSTARKSRLQQLVDWCGGADFDGCLIFDECHKAKNFVVNKEQASSKVALAVTEIQRLLPKARVVYCSATGVTNVKNMAFMERLGLWGNGAPFKNFNEFLDIIHSKGLGVAEMLAMEMKSTGMYVSRGLSFKQAEFITVEIPLTVQQRKVYDTAVHVWGEMRKALEHAAMRTVSSSRIWTEYWSAHQRFFKQLCMGLKVPAIVAEAQAALESGYAVIIGLQSTGEASLHSVLNTCDRKLKKFVSVCREILIHFLKVNFPTTKEKKADDSASQDEWSVQAKHKLLEYAEAIELPDCPLDILIDQLGGPDKVAEMTGRYGRIVRELPKSILKYEDRSSGKQDSAVEKLNVHERNMFMAGKKLVAIISDAASTGISLHADLRGLNTRRRLHITMELPWSADKAVQQLGRSHRSNQSSGPLYKLMTTDLGGERRFAASVARRLQSLGALTKGDRRAATGVDLTEFNFDTPYGRSALKMLYHSICQKQLAPGVQLSQLTSANFDDFINMMQECLVQMGLVEENILRSFMQVPEKHASDVSRFLNRILGLTTDRQNLIFSYFTEIMDILVQNAKRDGRYTEGLLDITAASIQMVGQPQEVFQNLQKGYGITRMIELVVDRGMSWEQALQRYDNYKHLSSCTGFYVSKRDMFGCKMYILVTSKENSTHHLRIARPSTGVSPLDQEQSDLLHKYRPISMEDAEKGWKSNYDVSKDACMHGHYCKHRNTCSVGKRCYHLHLLCGNIATLMSVLETTLNRNSLKLGLSKYESQVRVVRVALDSGERIVGVRYPEILIPVVEQVLKEQKLYDRMCRVQEVLTQKQLASVVQQPSELTTSLPTLSKDKAYVQSQAEVENVTPVNEKMRRQILRPPVTIKSFFKPKTFSNTASGSGIDGTEDKKKERVKDNPTSLFTRANASYTMIQKPVEDKHKCPDQGDSKICESKHDSSQNDFQVVKKQLKSPVDERVLSLRQGKRKKLSVPATSLKPKQVKMASSDSKLQVALRAEMCPVCNIEFKLGTRNEDINSHIDNCLIE